MTDIENELRAEIERLRSRIEDLELANKALAEALQRAGVGVTEIIFDSKGPT